MLVWWDVPDGDAPPFIVAWLRNEGNDDASPGGNWVFKTEAGAKRRFAAEVAKASGA
jgi:hypothetical protein